MKDNSKAPETALPSPTRRQLLQLLGAGIASTGRRPAAADGDAPPQRSAPLAGKPDQVPIEVVLTIPESVIAQTNPFDYTQNDIHVTFVQSGLDHRSITVPAFFDGDGIWRARYLPTSRRRYRVGAVTRNGVEVARGILAPKPDGFDFTPSGRDAGFVRRDPDHPIAFRHENGATYYPIGCNAAWGHGGHDGYLLGVLEKLAVRGGANWARVWMNHWDGKNLDWETGRRGAFDRLDLDAARRWDRIVDVAGAHGLHLQITLQHHGPYSSRVDSNWKDNPWNKANGGFLATPADFFTDDRARALTRSKYRYILARWGWSPRVLAWELFNEVQWCDPIYDRHPEVVTAWHREMADFLRAQDVHRHLITTSSDTHIPGLYDAVDYVQPHTYPADIVSAVTASDPVYSGRPYFFGEFGPAGQADPARMRETFQSGLWASLTTLSAGAAQFWYWDAVDDHDLYPVLRSAADFVRSVVGSEVLTRLRSTAAVVVSTPRNPGVVSAGPGGGWAAARQTEFTVEPSGEIDGLSQMPAYLQGNSHREMFPHADFHVDYAVGGTFSVILRQSARAGAHLRLAVDGVVVAEQALPAADSDQNIRQTVTANVPAGRHTVRLENTGADWIAVDRLTLTPYGASLRALARADAKHALVYLSRPITRDTPMDPIAGATVAIPGLLAGAYRVRWWDTVFGQVVREERARSAGNAAVKLSAPQITGGDIAVFVSPA